MKAVYWQRGESLDYTNSGDVVIEANTILDFKTRIAVAGADIQPGEKGAVHVTGVYKFPKTDTDAVSIGAALYFDGEGITTSESGTPAGYAAAQSEAGAANIFVKLLG